MTDHPSNPPSQGTGIATDFLAARPHTSFCWFTIGGAPCDCRDPRSLALVIDSDLAAQEARHKAELEEAAREVDCEGSVNGPCILAPSKGIERLCWMHAILRDQRRYAEAESKLRQATEALGMVMNEWVNGRRVGDGITLTTAQIALAAIRSGPAQQAASFGPPMSPEMMAKAERARKFFVPVPDDPLDVGPDPDYGLLGDPPEQETAKPGEPTSLEEHAFVRCELQDERQCTAWRKCHHPECLALGLLDDPIHASAPPAHGGGD